MKLHETVTTDRVLEAAQRSMFGTDNPGICIECGEDQEGCEPDAELFPAGAGMNRCGRGAF